MNRIKIPILLAGALLATGFLAAPRAATAQNSRSKTTMVQDQKTNQMRRDDGRLSFQTLQPWTPRTNINGDIAMLIAGGCLTLLVQRAWARSS